MLRDWARKKRGIISAASGVARAETQAPRDPRTFSRLGMKDGGGPCIELSLPALASVTFQHLSSKFRAT